MPLFGTLDLQAALADAPTVTSLTPETWSLPGASVLQVSYEVDEYPALAITPPGLHPSIPPYATFSVIDAPESPVGPFTLAMVRLIVRAGIRPRGLLVGGFITSPAAAEALTAGWGYRLREADVTLARRHNQITGTVAVDGVVALDARLADPEPIVSSDLELFDSLHLANIADDEPALIQVDPTYLHSSADRGKAELAIFDADRLGCVGIDPVYKLVGVACTSDIELNAPRFVIDPAKPAVQATRRLQPS